MFLFSLRFVPPRRIGSAIAFTLLCGLISIESASAVTLFSESFETEGEGTRWVSTGEFRAANLRYFMRTNNQQNSGQDLADPGTDDDRRYGINGATGNSYQGIDGSFVWAAEEINFGGRPNPAVLTLNDVTTTGYTNLTFSGLFGGTRADDNDSMLVSYALNGSSTFTPALSFLTVAINNGQLIALDTDNNGRGDPGLANENILDELLKTFTFSIPDADSVSLRVAIVANSSSDEFAFDFFQIQGDLIQAESNPGVPEPGTGLLLICGLTALLARRRNRI